MTPERRAELLVSAKQKRRDATITWPPSCKDEADLQNWMISNGVIRTYTLTLEEFKALYE